MNPLRGLTSSRQAMAWLGLRLLCSARQTEQVLLKHPLPQLDYSSVVSHWQFRGSDKIHVSLSVPQAETLEASKWTILCLVLCLLLGLPLWEQNI